MAVATFHFLIITLQIVKDVYKVFKLLEMPLQTSSVTSYGRGVENFIKTSKH